ncbi:MAG: molybdopterin-binding protein [Campylobacterota bacterium]|nr:molybdopterin-binding protein [Campylobacterota bacterium]
MKNPHFYAVIIGTEILNGRRQDKHFAFVRTALAQRGYELFASLTIKDDASLIEKTFATVREDKDAVLFSFGGIGSTPDDLTREIASQVFTAEKARRHEQFEQDIIDRFGGEAYPHRIHMADLPKGSKLLKNPVNNMSGFYLDERYFFVPGFPEMAHTMIEEALDRFFPKQALKHRRTLKADTGENTLISLMEELPEGIELSSLPMIRDGVPSVELSLASKDESILNHWFEKVKSFLKEEEIGYRLLNER